jgi:hypothetical protein
MKKILSFILGLVLLTSVSAQAQISQAFSLATGQTNVVSGEVYLSQITYSGTGTLWFYDAPATNLLRTFAAYTNVSSSITTNVSTYVGYYGMTNNVTNIVFTLATNTVAAATNSYPQVYIAAMSGSPTTVTFTPGRLMLNGITVASTNTANVTVWYSK